MDKLAQAVRIAEAIVFASAEPVAEETIAERLPDGVAPAQALRELKGRYNGRGVNLVQVAGGWAFRTAPDLAPVLRAERPSERKLSRAALETLAIIAYHQPVTRSEIEDIRGVTTSKGTIDQLLEAGWVQPGRRRQVPGRPVTWVTTAGFLDHFGLAALEDLPGLRDLAAAGLIEKGPSVVRLPGSAADGEGAEGEGTAAEGADPHAHGAGSGDGIPDGGAAGPGLPLFDDGRDGR
jgi:segregation and condensation protein B